MTKEEKELMCMALEALKEALDAIESWGSYASDYFQVKHDLEGDIKKTKTSITALEKCLANDALEKKAENARELGLNYDPENTLHWHALNYRTTSTQNAQKMFDALEQFVEKSIRQAIEQAQQAEPDYYGLTKDHLWMSITKGHYDRLKPEFRMACYTSPPPRQPLTDEEMFKIWVSVPAETEDRFAFARAIEAAHGIKEKHDLPKN